VKIYRANRAIKHGAPDGSVVKYAPGAEVPAELARTIPALVDMIEIEGVERVGTGDGEQGEVSLSRMNLAALQEIATSLGIDLGEKTRKELIVEIKAAQQLKTEA